MIHADDLPRHIREQLGIAKSKPSRRSPSELGLPLTCTTCWEVIPNSSEHYLRKHQDANPTHGHYRWVP